MKNSKNIIIALLSIIIVVLVVVMLVNKQKQGAYLDSAASTFNSTVGSTAGIAQPTTIVVGTTYVWLNGVCWNTGASANSGYDHWSPTPLTLAGCPGARIVRQGFTPVTKDGLAPTGTVTPSDVQQRLQNLGFYSGKISGSLDSSTTTAIKGYQKALKLPTTGTLSTDTLKALFEINVTVKQ